MNFMHPYTNSCTKHSPGNPETKKKATFDLHTNTNTKKLSQNPPKTKNSPEILTFFPNFHQLLGLRKFRNENVQQKRI